MERSNEVNPEWEGFNQFAVSKEIPLTLGMAVRDYWDHLG